MIRDSLYFILFFSITLRFGSQVQAQNLIPNPGFEDFHTCPEKPGNAATDLTSWTMPTQGSTDFFHICSTPMGIPDNFNGNQPAYEGEGYVGFYTYAPNDYREYLQVKLLQPLLKDSTYTLSFRVSLAERSDFAVAGIDALFTSKSLDVPTKRHLTKKYWLAQGAANYHFLEDVQPVFYNNTQHWKEVKTSFTAKGTERYLIIGNFKPNRQTRILSTGVSSNKGAYYYLDALSLISNYPKEAPKTYALNTLMVLPAVLFNFDTSLLTPQGQSEVQKIADFMHADQSLSIEIRGHTDALGSADYNDSLSRERCKAVVSFLRALGISENRIFWQGFGATLPVGDNRTASGRQQNRRVEFRFHKQ